MTKLTLASHPYLLGFDQLERLVERTAKSGNEGYPPYNIERLQDDHYRISLAVAGFSEAELDVNVKERTLVLKGEKKPVDEENTHEMMHRGIAFRNFERRFQLADDVEVTGANLKDGLLHLDLLRIIPEEKKPRSIAIGTEDVLTLAKKTITKKK